MDSPKCGISVQNLIMILWGRECSRIELVRVVNLADRSNGKGGGNPIMLFSYIHIVKCFFF